MEGFVVGLCIVGTAIYLLFTISYAALNDSYSQGQESVRSYVVQSCDKTGAFWNGDTVYECKVRP